jgi:hypothetical protein
MGANAFTCSDLDPDSDADDSNTVNGVEANTDSIQNGTTTEFGTGTGSDT